jgi:hypothetical protein
MYDEIDNEDEAGDQLVKKVIKKPQMKLVHFSSAFERNSSIYTV